MSRLHELAYGATLKGMSRYAIPSYNAIGVPMKSIQQVGKEVGIRHDLADPLWNTGVYEAQTLVAYIADPELLTSEQMDRWWNEFDSWAIGDTLGFKLFDRSPLALEKVDQWSRDDRELQKRAGFALLACVAAHDKLAPDETFLSRLPFFEWGGKDDRNFVKKGVSWALRVIGLRKLALHDASSELARSLVESHVKPLRWIGKDAPKEFSKPGIRDRLAARAR